MKTTPVSTSSTAPYPRPYYSIASTCCALLLAFTVVPAMAQSPGFEELERTQGQTIAAGAESQSRVDALDDERTRLAADYRSALGQAADLEIYNEQLRGIIDDQQAQAASLQRQIADIAHLEQDMVPLTNDMLLTLERFIALDLPFLLEERQQRVAKLRELMTRAGVSNSEKFRRVLEAYQIENDYGRSIEATESTIVKDGETQRVNFFKVGRVAYFYQTLDGKHSYRWDQTSKQWLPLPQDLNREIERGIKMAREQITSDLLRVPVLVN